MSSAFAWLSTVLAWLSSVLAWLSTLREFQPGLSGMNYGYLAVQIESSSSLASDL